eukprot:jgi/Picre1/28075/NNA_001034.t1
MKVSVLFLLLLSSVVCQQTQGENGLSSTSVDEKEHTCDGQLADSLKDKVVACEKKLEDALSVYEKEKGILTEKNTALKGRVGELESRVRDLEKEAKGLQSTLEKEARKVSSLENDLRKEQSSRTRSSKESAERLDEAMRELDVLRRAWLPVWMSARLGGLERVGERAIEGARPLIDASITFFKTRVVPVGRRGVMLGWRVCQQGLAMMQEKAGSVWERTVPVKYRTTMNAYVRMVKTAWRRVKRAVYPVVVQYSRRLKAQVIIAVDEISRLVEVSARKYPKHLSWAGQGSRPVAIAIFILCFPFIAFGMPLASSMLVGQSSPKPKSSGKKKKKKGRA